MRTIAMFSLIVAVLDSTLEASIPKFDSLTKALIVIESNGWDTAIGDKKLKEKAYGCLQIREPVCKDVNRRYGTNYRAQDMLGNRGLSLWVCQKYLEMYATEKRLGRKPTMEDMARIWNGGPNGCFNNGAIDSKGTLLKDPKARARLAAVQKKTKHYWDKVRRVL